MIALLLFYIIALHQPPVIQPAADYHSLQLTISGEQLQDSTIDLQGGEIWTIQQ